eukprot:gene2616-5518_t
MFGGKVLAVGIGTVLCIVVLYFGSHHQAYLADQQIQMKKLISSLENQLQLQTKDVSQQRREITEQTKKIDAIQNSLAELKVQAGADDGTCAINPSFYFEDTGEIVPECPLHLPLGVLDINQVFLPEKVFMLNLPGQWENFRARRDDFQRHGITLERFKGVDGSKTFHHIYRTVDINGKRTHVYLDPVTKEVIRPGAPGYLSPGERGYLASMQQIFESVLNSKTNTFAVFDDDAVLHCDFVSQMKRVMAQRRCGLPVQPHGTGGALLLGSSVWINGTWPERGKYTGGWAQIEQDLNRVRAVSRVKPLCFNVDSKTMGSFGVIYHRKILPTALDWIKSTTVPFDHIWKHLVAAGFAVRAAYPSLVIQDVRHASAVDETRKGQENLEHRARLHRWHIPNFCDPLTGKPMLLND